MRTFCVRVPTTLDSSSILARSTSSFDFDDLTHLMGHWPDLQNLYLYPGSIVTSSPSTLNDTPWIIPPNLPRMKGLVISTPTDLRLLRKFLSLTRSLEQLSLSLTCASQVDEVTNVLKLPKDTLKHLDLKSMAPGGSSYQQHSIQFSHLHHLRVLKLIDKFFPPHLLETSLPPSIEFLTLILYQDDFAAVAKALDSKTLSELSSGGFECIGPFAGFLWPARVSS
ncbi:hypothetical protein JAAARDRAFT_199248 [Jaapia argillacea MUCL 33604]|uniref:F-box domain-containing protein n=1 Tax=Jaapia argillacea MUCL 33604 TaxID=933084 RepID=A0A067P8U7_9AGAM|nr:hypothetical protein JAAARDRAFT_199248 [Jaapia argillacea MUCL 33604]